jgi:hypothetical protein
MYTLKLADQINFKMKDFFQFLSVTDITALIQILLTVIGGGYALFLLSRNNNEKRQNYILHIFDKLYNDEDILQVLYAVDKNYGLEGLGDKVIIMKENPAYDYKEKVLLEKEVDKTLRYLDFIGVLLNSGQLKKKDLAPFRYELKKILNNSILSDYIGYLDLIGANFENLKYLRQEIKKLD